MSHHNRQGSANASSSVARLRSPSSDHLAIVSPTVARIQMNPSCHVQLSSTFESPDLAGNIEKFIEDHNETSRHNKDGEFIVHSSVSELFCNLERNCNSACELIQKKKSCENPTLEFIEKGLAIKLFDPYARTFNVSARVASSLIAASSHVFSIRNVNKIFSETSRVDELFCNNDIIARHDSFSDALTVDDPADMKIYASIKKKLKKKEILARKFKIREGHGKNLILKLPVSCRFVIRDSINWIVHNDLIEPASGWPEKILKCEFWKIVKKVQKIFLETYRFILLPENCINIHHKFKDSSDHDQRLTIRSTVRIQRFFKKSKTSTNNKIEKKQLVRFPVKDEFFVRQHVDNMFLKFLPQQVAFSLDKHVLRVGCRPEALPVSIPLALMSNNSDDLEVLTLQKSSLIELFLQRQKERKQITTTATAHACPESLSWRSRSC